MDEVGRAVKGVNDPVASALDPVASALFTENTAPWQCSGKPFDEHELGLLVYVAYQ